MTGVALCDEPNQFVWIYLFFSVVCCWQTSCQARRMLRHFNSIFWLPLFCPIRKGVFKPASKETDHRRQPSCWCRGYGSRNGCRFLFNISELIHLLWGYLIYVWWLIISWHSKHCKGLQGLAWWSQLFIWNKFHCFLWGNLAFIPWHAFSAPKR